MVPPFLYFEQSFVTNILKEQTMGKIIFYFIFIIFYILTFHTQTKSPKQFSLFAAFSFFWQQWDTMRNMTLFIYARLFNIVKNQQQQQRWEYSRLKCIAIRELLPKYSPLLLSNKRNICLKNDGLQHRIIHDGFFSH